MNKIYKHLNRINIEEDYEGEALSNDEVNDYFQQFKSNNRIKKKPKKARKSLFVTAAAILFFMTSVALNDDIQASVSTFLDDFSYNLSNIISPNATEYATEVNQVIRFENADLKLTDIVIDDQFVTYNVLIDAHDDIKVNGLYSKPLKINGKTYTGGGSGQLGLIDEVNNVYSLVMTERLEDAIPEGDLNIRLAFTELSYFKEGTELRKKMNAVYEFTASKSLLAQNTNQVALNQTFSIGDFEITLEEFIINPVTARFESYAFNANLVYDILLIDQEGMTYLFNLTSKRPSETSERFDAILSFNPDFSTGTIDDLKNAEYLIPEFKLSYTPEKSGEVQNLESPSGEYEKIILK
ncbi:hypothetical protein [Cytobacillus sp.]|uniref:hypothetical protein n=1 Tax=Cytobacillus sp. TaxID=2675269 RepID=UPI0028BD5B46|nr:hypothetical protein [Cytobacillus sp.]